MPYGSALAGIGSDLLDVYKIKQAERQQQFQNLQAQAADRRAGVAAMQESELQPYRVDQAKLGLRTSQQALQQGQQQIETGELAQAEVRKTAEGKSKGLLAATLHLESDKQFANSMWGKIAKTEIASGNLDKYYDAAQGYQKDILDREKLTAADKLAGQKAETTSPTLQRSKDERLAKFIEVSETKKLKIDAINQAEAALDQIPTGLIGKNIIKYKETFDPNDPVLASWQRIKMVLTDAQLMNSEKTKGAISDKEQELFAEAAANDKIPSPQKMKEVFGRLKNYLNSEEKIAATTYQRLYGEDPYEVIGTQSPGVDVERNEISEQEFNAMDDTTAANFLKSGGKVRGF